MSSGHGRGKEDRLGGEAVDARRGRARVAVTAEMVGAQRVDQVDDEIRARLRAGSGHCGRCVRCGHCAGCVHCAPGARFARSAFFGPSGARPRLLEAQTDHPDFAVRPGSAQREADQRGLRRRADELDPAGGARPNRSPGALSRLVFDRERRAARCRWSRPHPRRAACRGRARTCLRQRSPRAGRASRRRRRSPGAGQLAGLAVLRSGRSWGPRRSPAPLKRTPSQATAQGASSCPVLKRA